MAETLLNAQNVSIAFGEVRALNDVSITINKGEIRCLAGENGSGKSTFTKIVSGVYTPDTGEIEIDGKRMASHDPREAIDAGVQVIYQDLSLFNHLTVAENIAINRLLHEGHRLVRRKEMHEIAAEQLQKMRVDLDLNVHVSTLSVANKQLVAIARALSMDAKILFMDEPTSALTTHEVKRLLTIVHELKEAGLAIVFISHKLDEVFEVADTITVFRDGEKVGDYAAKEMTPVSLSAAMTGREIMYKDFHRKEEVNPGEVPLLEIENLNRTGNYKDVSFAVYPGDIVGLTGLLGSGRTELALSLFGLNKPDSGSIKIDGTPVTIKQPWDAMDLKIALVPEDRSTQALFQDQSMLFNLSSSSLGTLTNKLDVINRSKEVVLANEAVEKMRVNNKNLRTFVRVLSGGNQQKTVIGKWLATNPRLLILDSPTVGIDIGSKSEIYENIHNLAHEGMGIIMISDEPEEIFANCNKVIVMQEGNIVANFDESDRAKEGFPQLLAQTISARSQQESEAAL